MPAKFILLGVGAFILLFIIVGIMDEIGKHGIHKIAFRWFTGQPYHGRGCPTNATWFKKGTKPDSGIHPWHYLPRAHRSIYRLCGTTIFISIVYGAIKNHMLIIKILSVITTISFLVIVVMIIRRIRAWITDKTYRTPLSMALSTLLDINEMAAQKALTFIPNMLTAKKGEIGRLVLPPKFLANDAQKQAIENLFRNRLPISVEFKWHTATKKTQYLSILASPRLPKMVKFLDKLKDIYECAENEVLLGIMADGTLKKWDLSADEPHMLASANTRRGKTRLAMLIVCQVLRKGGRATMIDPKRVGLDEFVAGHPNAIVYSEPREVETNLWQPIVDFYNLLNERIDAYKEDRTITFKRELLVIDEISLWASKSKQYWDEIRSGKDKATPPIFYTLCNCLWAGAQFNCNVLIFGQVLGHNVLGNAIEAFGTRLMGGFTKQAYMRLIGITPIPVSQRGRGRFLYHDGGEYPDWIQCIYGEIEDMHAFAIEPFSKMAGVPIQDINTQIKEKDIKNTTEIDIESASERKIRIVKTQ
jgi:hypothetical protein